MTKKRLPKSVRKHIRRKKAEIRNRYSDEERQKEEIEKIYKKFKKYYDDKTDI